MRTGLLFTFLISLALAVAANAQNASSGLTPRIFVAPTSDGFSSFVSSAFFENKLPILVTTDELSADYIVVSGGVKGQNRWYDTVFGVERDRNQGSMRLVRVRDKAVVWAASSGDRSLWWGGLKNMGLAKVANRLARKLKDDIPDLRLEAGTAPERPASAEKYNLDGVEAFKQQKFAAAEAAFREAVKLDPYNAAFHHNLGSSLNSQGKFQEAEKEIELAMRLEPAEAVYKQSLDAVKANRPSN